MQVIATMDNKIPVIETYRLDPTAVKGSPPPVFPKTRVPGGIIDRVKNGAGKFQDLLGPAGTHFVFTPNIMHRGTIPAPGVEPREAMFMFLRPSLKKMENYTSSANSFLPEKNVKKYELD